MIGLPTIVAIATNAHPEYRWHAADATDYDAVILTGATKPLTDRFGETLHMAEKIGGMRLADVGEDAVLPVADFIAAHLAVGL